MIKPASEVLNAFCDRKQSSYATPFFWDGWAYATNGHVAIRIKEEVAPIRANAPRADLLAEWAALDRKTPDWILRAATLAKIQESVEVCPLCSPDVVTELCPDCEDGDCYREYGCKFCNETRYKSLNTLDCYRCLGSRWVTKAQWKIGDRLYNVQYLSKMTQWLGDLRLYVSKEGVLAFKFDGGEGLFMPLIDNGTGAINEEVK